MKIKVYIKVPQITVQDVAVIDEEGIPIGETQKVLSVPFKLPELSSYGEQNIQVDLPTTKAAVLAKIKQRLSEIKVKIQRDNAAKEAIGFIPVMTIEV